MALGMTDEVAKTKVLGFSRVMSKWCAQYLLPEPHDNAPSIDFGRDIPYQSLAVTKVVDIEVQYTMPLPPLRSSDPPRPSQQPCTLHPAPCTLHPAPCTLHPAPCTLHPAP